jgi:hypothetical protein
MLGNLLREVAIENAPKQRILVDAITDEAPILGMLPMEPASDGLSNVYEKLDSVTGPAQVDLDGVLPQMYVNTSLEQKDLQVLGGIIEVGQDKGRMYTGGVNKYFEKYSTRCLKEAGQSIEYSLIYSTFREYALANGNVVNAGGTTATSQNSIIAVHFSPGEIMGLYDSIGMGKGKFFRAEPINGGNAYFQKTTGVLVYGLAVKTYFGVQLANPRYVSAMVNIEDAADMTLARLDETLDKCRANPMNTVLFMATKTRDFINQIRAGTLQTGPKDDNLRTRVMYYNDIPIVTSYNFTAGKEAVVTV